MNFSIVANIMSGVAHNEQGGRIGERECKSLARSPSSQVSQDSFLDGHKLKRVDRLLDAHKDPNSPDGPLGPHPDAHARARTHTRTQTHVHAHTKTRRYTFHADKELEGG